MNDTVDVNAPLVQDVPPVAPVMEPAPIAPVVPPVAPAPVPPVPAPAPAVPATEDEVFPTVEDPAMNMALEFANRVGLKANDPAIEAAFEGNFILLKAKLASMGAAATGWEQMVAIAENAFSAEVQRFQEQIKEVNSIVVEAAGSAENWQAVHQWAQANTDPAEAEIVNSLMDKGGVAAKIAAAFLVTQYRQSSETVIEPEMATAFAPAASQGTPTNGPLTAAQYKAAIAELQSRSRGMPLEELPEYAQLRARRQAGMNQFL